MAERSDQHDHESRWAVWRSVAVLVTTVALLIRRDDRRGPQMAAAGRNEHPHESVTRYGHASPEFHWRRVLVIVGVLALMVVLVVVGDYTALRFWLAPNHAQVVAQPAPIPPEPRLQPHPQTDIAAYRAQMHQLLSTYAWKDPSHSYARIPIERAMTIYAKQHAAEPAPASTAGVRR